jgi:signal transduction histidine kinase
MPSRPEPDATSLLDRIRRLEGQLEDALREKATADLQIDRTERSLLASYRELAQKNAALLEKNAALETALAAEAQARALAEERENLLRQIVHDQRTDLMNIAIAVDIARQLPGTETAFDAIQQSVERIERFLSEKTAQLKGLATTTTTEVGPLMSGLVARLREQFAAKHLQCDLVLPSAAVAVPLSEVACEQIAQNLLSNAMKHAPPGSVVTFAAETRGDRVILRVADEGPGIPEHLLPAIGDGHRADHDQPGSGLGLRNVRTLLEAAAGRLTWRNGTTGAVFEVDLPLIV